MIQFLFDHWINLVDLIVLGVVLFLQIKNYLKYRDTNGHLKKRIVMCLSVLFLITHVIRLMFDITTGAFLFFHVITWLMIYDAINISSVWELIKSKFKKN